MIPISWLLLLLPGSAQDAVRYEGKYSGHPNLAQVLASVNSSKDEARMQIPKRLGVAVAEFSVELVDLDNMSREESPWPPQAGIRRFGEGRREQEKWSLYLQMDHFVGNPALVRPALMREIAKVSLFSAKRDDIGRWMFRPSGAWLLDSLASQFAGTTESEIAYTLNYGLITSERIETLVGGITEGPPPKNMREGFTREVTYEGRLTPHFSARFIHAKAGEKQYIELLEAVYRGQAFESVLKKATGKNIEQFNASIQTEFKNYLGKNLAKADIDLFKRSLEALDKKDPESALKSAEDLLKKSPNSILTGSTLYLKGRALYEMKRPESVEVLKQVLSKHRGATPLAKEAQHTLALALLESGNATLAKLEFERLRDDFGWDAISVKRAQENLDKLRQ